MDDLTVKVEQSIRAEKLFAQKDSIVVAVSGGSDSVALLHVLFLLSEVWQWKLVVAHVNHRFRGEESDREAEYVSRLSNDWGLACETAFIDVPAYIEESGMNSQSAAREKRYEFLHQVAEKYGASHIALAHHADDQAETVLMRLIRGAGLAGLSGMQIIRREKNVELVRPFLRIYKTEVLAHCELHGLVYYEDSSNRDTKYFRNRIRLEIMPYLERFNDRLPESLNRTAEIAAIEDEYMEAEGAKLLEEHVTQTAGKFHFSRSWFSSLHIALQRRLIKLILSCLGGGTDIDFSKVEQVRGHVLHVSRSNMRIDVTGQILLTTEYDTAHLHTMVLPQGPYAYSVITGTREVAIPEAGSVITLEWEQAGHPERHLDRKPRRNELWLDADEIAYPLCIRNRRQGDRISIFGLNGSKKVKDIFIDDKVPRGQREQTPIVADHEGRILWIAGFRRSAHALVTPKTRSILYMKLTQLMTD